MEEYEVKVVLNGKEEIFTLKKLTFGERNRLIEECSEIKVVGKETITKINPTIYKEMIILRCLKNAPIPKTREAIANLPADVGELLFKKCEEINFIDDTKK